MYKWDIYGEIDISFRFYYDFRPHNDNAKPRSVGFPFLDSASIMYTNWLPLIL